MYLTEHLCIPDIFIISEKSEWKDIRTWSAQNAFQFKLLCGLVGLDKKKKKWFLLILFADA